MLLTHIVPVPVMLLAANRRSTGIGVRPRTDRIEVTADFTPDAALMIATATLIVGVVREVMTWPSFELAELARHDIPVVHRASRPSRTARGKAGSRAFTSFDENPFARTSTKHAGRRRDGEVLSLRAIAATDHALLPAVDSTASAIRARCV